MKKKIIINSIRFLFIILLISCFSFCNSNNTSSEDTLYESLISTKWKLRYHINNNVEYYLEFKDSLYIAQFFHEEDRNPKMYPGEWSLEKDTLFINDRRGDFHLLIQELNDSLMVLQKTDSVNLIFDIQPNGFYWE